MPRHNHTSQRRQHAKTGVGGGRKRPRGWHRKATSPGIARTVAWLAGEGSA